MRTIIGLRKIISIVSLFLLLIAVFIFIVHVLIEIQVDGIATDINAGLDSQSAFKFLLALVLWLFVSFIVKYLSYRGEYWKGFNNLSLIAFIFVLLLVPGHHTLKSDAPFQALDKFIIYFSFFSWVAYDFIDLCIPEGWLIVKTD